MTKKEKNILSLNLKLLKHKKTYISWIGWSIPSLDAYCFYSYIYVNLGTKVNTLIIKSTRKKKLKDGLILKEAKHHYATLEKVVFGIMLVTIIRWIWII